MSNSYNTKYTPPGQVSVMRKESLKTALDIFERINDIVKGIGLVGGGIMASLADWIFGTVTFSILFSNYEYGPNLGWMNVIVGFALSMGAWGVQLIMWQILMTGRHKRFSGVLMAVLGMIILMKIADDVTDLMAVYWMLKDNPLQSSPAMPHNIYMFFFWTVFVLVWILVGFSEIFVSFSISILRGQESSKQFQPQAAARDEGQPPHRNRPINYNRETIDAINANLQRGGHIAPYGG